jgi:hypothetical protein
MLPVDIERMLPVDLLEADERARTRLGKDRGDAGIVMASLCSSQILAGEGGRRARGRGRGRGRR